MLRLESGGDKSNGSRPIRWPVRFIVIRIEAEDGRQWELIDRRRGQTMATLNARPGR
jgi:hypothetical protein